MKEDMSKKPTSFKITGEVRKPDEGEYYLDRNNKPWYWGSPLNAREMSPILTPIYDEQPEDEGTTATEAAMRNEAERKLALDRAITKRITFADELAEAVRRCLKEGYGTVVEVENALKAYDESKQNNDYTWETVGLHPLGTKPQPKDPKNEIQN